MVFSQHPQLLKSYRKMYINTNIIKYINYITTYLLCLQVRTLFVSGLPMDAKPRELYLLFRAYKVSHCMCAFHFIILKHRCCHKKSHQTYHTTL